jgi:putative peptide zinc metalloprotease protein
MGIAFMVMVPVLFTDVTDAWRLPSRSQRLLIDAAGMLAELCLAALATLLWSFLPDGPLRSAAFMLATVTWVTTLLINLNPLMRFDGYFLLSDLLGIQNLQQRGFELARWQLREWLFAVDEPPPETLPRRSRRAVLIWAYCTWIYRFFLFTGIALLVYHAFFKLLGIALMAVELGWFISAPLLRELKEWWARRAQLRGSRRAWCSAGGALLVLAALVLPWQSRVALPAIIEAADYTALYPPAPAQVATVQAAPGEAVRAGQVLYTLAAPDLAYQLARATQQLELTQRQILRQAASRETLGQLGVLESRLTANLAEVRGLRAQQQRLIVRAPGAGVLRDVPPGLRPGLWLSETSMLGRVVAREHARLRAYVRASDLNRIEIGAAGNFYPEDPALPALPVRVTKIEGIGVAALEIPYLASTYGGPLAVRVDRSRGAVPTESLYRVVLQPTGAAAPAPEEILRGTARVDAEAASPLRRLWRLALATLIRESGF